MEPNVPGANFINPTPPNEAMKKNGFFNVFLLSLYGLRPFMYNSISSVNIKSNFSINGSESLKGLFLIKKIVL